MVLDREHSRMVDQIAVREFGMSGLVLMENAGRGCAQDLLRLGVDGTVVVCCGSGNNGGDGFVIARHLAIAGIKVRVMLAAKPSELSPDARANYEILAKTATRIECLPHASSDEIRRHLIPENEDKLAWIVDALLGTGASGPLRPPIDGWIRQMNLSKVKTLAVDIPSGLDCDTGQTGGDCVRASQTCTLVSLKPCFLREPGRHLAGIVSVIDIGVPKEIKFAVEQHQISVAAIDFACWQSENGRSQ